MKSITEALKYLKTIGIELSEDEYLANGKKKSIVGMSGGVDSSVCAVLAQLMGFETIGIFMRNWEEIDASGVCTAEEDYKDVIGVCEHLDIPYYSLNLSQEYKDLVFDEFVEEYKKGHTPNPDILCNREIKFKVFFEKAIELGGDYLVTGHYCRKSLNEKNQFQLLKGLDHNKDQSYFLYAIKGEVLNKVLFPIGHLEKPIVRKVAEDFKLVTMKKKDSTGICFIGERNFKKFLSEYINSQKGSFIHLDNRRVMGSHDGMCFYTIGQRKGLGLGGPGGPWFVASKDILSNTVFVVEGEYHPALYADELIADEITWINDAPEFPVKCQVKIRYRQADQACTVHQESDGELRIVFDAPQRAIAIKQSVVLYQGDVCLGGAQIKTVGPSYYEQGKLPVL